MGDAGWEATVRGVYYNEFDAYAAEWLCNLAGAGHVAQGTVDTRDIRNVNAADLVGHERVHLFAGIGGWELALALAGWPAGRPAWTGSCPCQPFSTAGKRQGQEDERHLWPAMFRLVREGRPATVFGEQVDGAIGHGWLDGVFADLEAEGYACGAAVLPAACVGSPTIRHRLFWVATQLGDTSGPRLAGRTGQPGDDGPQQPAAERAGGDAGGVGDPPCDGGYIPLPSLSRGEVAPLAAGGANWAAYDLLPCSDGRHRRVESGTFPLAARIPRDLGRVQPGVAGLVRGARRNRVGRLRGYGNSIVPQVAAVFIRAFLEAEAS